MQLEAYLSNMANATGSLVNWAHEERIDEALEMAQRSGKPLFIDLYAPGCKGCERLERTTYRENTVAALLNERFIPVLLNARRPSDALRTLNGLYSYVFSPVLIFRTANGRELRRTIGFLSPEAMLLELHIGLAADEMERDSWVSAHRILDEALNMYRHARNVPEAMWWRGVAAYRSSGNNVAVLREAWAPLITEYRKTIWAEKADILNPPCEC